MVYRLINEGKILNASTQSIDLFTPSTIDGYSCDGGLFDIFVTVELKSITELPYISKPDGSTLMTMEELDADFNDRTSNAPAKCLTIEYRRNNVVFPGTKILIYRREPSFTENLKQYLTTQNKLGIAFGTTIRARMENYNSGLLSGADTLSFWLIGEEGKSPEIDALATKYLV
jgi:hypothetical protein